MKRKPSTAPVVDSPWAISILPSTSKRPPTDAVRATASAPDAPPPAPASAPLAAPSSLAAPTWSPAPLTPSQSSFVSAPHLGAERQFGADTFGASSQYGPPAQFAPPPQYAPPPQFSPPAQFPQPAQFGSPAQFAPPAHQPAAYQPAAFPPPTNPPSGYQPNHFEPQGYAAPGYQAQGYAPPGQAQPYQNFPPTGGRSTGAKVAIGVVVGVVVLLVLAAIPVVLSRQPVAVTLTLAPTIEGSSRLDTPANEQLAASAKEQAFGNQTLFSDPQAAVYGDSGAPSFVIVAAKLVHRPTATEAAGFWKGTQNGASKVGATFVNVPPGPLGGTSKCSVIEAGSRQVLACLSLDNSALVYVIVYTDDLATGSVLAEQVRADVEHH